MGVCVLILDDKILYVAYKTVSGYVNKVFDADLGYIHSYVIDDQFIFASKVRIITYCMYVRYEVNPLTARIPTQVH